MGWQRKGWKLTTTKNIEMRKFHAKGYTRR